MNAKQQLQTDGLRNLARDRRVILGWATGCGKSKMVIDLINHNTDPLVRGRLISKALFVVGETAHINNWKAEFEKWKLRDNVKVDICCYNSIGKYSRNSYDVIVLDEAHHAFTEKKVPFLRELVSFMYTDSYVYLLSATLPATRKAMAEEIFGKFTTATVTLKEAIEKEILPEPVVYAIAMDLDNTKSRQEIQIGKDPKAPVISWEKRAKYIYKNTPCIIQCTEQQKYSYLTSNMDYWKQRYEVSRSEYQRNKWVNLGSQRKRFLGELKTGAVRKLIGRLPRRNRLVCFCASVAQAESLSAENTISSKRPQSLNEAIIDCFNRGQLNQLYAVGMITEGINLSGIHTGIIVQLDGKERLFIQKFGRTLRADNPVAFIFYYRNTQDEVYLKGALEMIDSKYVRHISINELDSIEI